MRMIYKRCPHCGRRIPAGERCPCGYKREYGKPEGTRKLYHGKAWQKLRAVVLARWSGLDPYAESHGRVEYAATVHHIVPAEEDASLFYSVSNLIPLSRASHDEIHATYRQSNEAKHKLQTELQTIVNEKLESVDP